MAKPRIQLHEILCDILGSRFCYYNPPANVQMRYPCIVYRWNNSLTLPADNIRYKNDRRYTVIVVDTEPDSEIAERLLSDERLSYISSDNNYVSDELHHYSFTIFY